MNSPASQPSRHILTVLHAAERTGPPLLALRFLRWLRRERPSWQLSTLFLDGGDLLEDFAEIGPTIIDVPSADGSGDRHPWLSSGIRNRRLQRTLSTIGEIDLAHVHCVGSMRAVPLLPRCEVLCHVHELSVGQDFHLGRAARDHLLTAKRYVAVSDAVRDELLDRFPIDGDLVERQWGFVDETALAGLATTRPFDAPPGAFVVIGSGVRNWRKGPELFVRTAMRARARHPSIPWHFIWVGGTDSSGLARLASDTLGTDLVQFVEHQPNPLEWIAAADVFMLSAREDAFPLVCVEAAALGRPLVSFDSGGTPELINAAGCGRVTPFPDVDAAADTLASLASDTAGRIAMGDAGRTFALRELVLATAGPRLLDTIERTMATP